MYFVKVILVLSSLNAARSKILPSKGPCFTLQNCATLNSLVQIRRNDFGTRILLNELYCYKKNDESYLRCPTKKQIDGFMGKTELLPPQEDCGLQSVKDLIDGGEVAELRDFPWLALLKYQKRGSEPRYGCTGNLISRRYILTAAHCLEQKRIKAIGFLNKVILGEYHIYNTTDCNGDDCTDGVKEYSVESYQIYPGYNRDLYQADIGLIRLDQDVQMTEFIKPICLPAGVIYLDPTETLWIGGWGTNSTLLMNDIKMKAKFKKLDHSGCSSSVVQTRNHICTTAKKYAKTCAGDSGGPLMALRKTSGYFRYYVAGVLSVGPQCERGLRFSIYTRVSGFVGWIIEQIY